MWADAVYEILVRTHLACGGTQTAKNLHSQTITLVRASAQAKAIEHILPDLTEEEETVYRHGRNAKPQDRAQVGNGRGVRPCDRARGAVRLAVSQAEI